MDRNVTLTPFMVPTQDPAVARTHGRHASERSQNPENSAAFSEQLLQFLNNATGENLPESEPQTYDEDHTATLPEFIMLAEEVTIDDAYAQSDIETSMIHPVVEADKPVSDTPGTQISSNAVELPPEILNLKIVNRSDDATSTHMIKDPVPVENTENPNMTGIRYNRSDKTDRLLQLDLRSETKGHSDSDIEESQQPDTLKVSVPQTRSIEDTINDSFIQKLTPPGNQSGRARSVDEKARSDQNDGSVVKHLPGTSSGEQTEPSLQDTENGMNDSNSTFLQSQVFKTTPPESAPALEGPSITSVIQSMESAPSRTIIQPSFGNPPRTIQYQVIDQVAQQIQVIQRQNLSETMFQLHPKHLGMMRLKIAVENSMVTARISVDREDTRQILEAAMPTLRQSLQEQGLKVDQVTIESGHAASDFQSQQQARPGRENRSSARIKSAQVKFQAEQDGIPESSPAVIHRTTGNHRIDLVL